MGLGFRLIQDMPTDVCEANITHNMTKMAGALGVYEALWHPEVMVDINKASDLLPIVEAALQEILMSPGKYKKYESVNGWGTTDWMTGFLDKVVKGCKEFPDAKIEVSV